MTLEDFIRALQQSLPPGSVLDNPGGGTSTIINYSKKFVAYRRGKSRIQVAYANLFDAYETNKGQTISSSDLRKASPGCVQ